MQKNVIITIMIKITKSASIREIKKNSISILFPLSTIMPFAAFLFSCFLLITLPAQAVVLTIDVSNVTGETIPNLSGNIVIKGNKARVPTLFNDLTTQKFLDEINPEIVQIKLFLNELDTGHTNFEYLNDNGAMDNLVREIHQRGGKVMLHFKNVPARLTMDASENIKGDDGKAPIFDTATVEWQQIITETINHFKQDPLTRLDYVQDIGEPNIGTNWYDPADTTDNAPDNTNDYFNFFQSISTAAQAADPDILFGGPTVTIGVIGAPGGGANSLVWMQDFIDSSALAGIPLGFVSIHDYPLDIYYWDTLIPSIRGEMDNHGYSKTPLIMTEWGMDANASNVPTELQISYIGAAFATRVLYKAFKLHFTPMAFQLMNADSPSVSFKGNNNIFLNDGSGVPLARYNALRLFSFLKTKQEINLTSDSATVFGLAAKDSNSIDILVSQWVVPDFDPGSSMFILPDTSATFPLTISITNLPWPRWQLLEYRIDGNHASAFDAGIENAELKSEIIDSGSGDADTIISTNQIYGVSLFRFSPVSIQFPVIKISIQGPQYFQGGETIVIDASGTFDPETFPLSFTWLMSPTNGISVAGGGESITLYVADTGLFQIALRVSNGDSISISDTIFIRSVSIIGDIVSSDGNSQPDGQVDIRDFEILITKIFSHFGDMIFDASMDLNQDNIIDFEDLMLMAKNY